MKKLHISETLALPIDFVTSTQVILAKKGKGKSYLAGVQAEELLWLGQQVVVIDPTGAWWGLRSSADGKHAGYSIAVLGGEHADVPLEATAGEVIADAIANEHFSAVIDLTLFRKGEALRFMAAFLETLYRKNRDALHLFIDEADVVAPQKTWSPEQARALGATEDIVRRGRIRGIGATLITQRPQVLNKDVLTQADMLTTLSMNHPKDLGAISDWVAVHGDPELAKKMNASLPSLPLGDAWFWAPGANVFERATVRRKRTFDSGKTPKAGERAIAPKVLAKVDLARLGTAIAATVERAKADDPKALRARVAELEKQLTAKPKIERSTPAISESELARIEKFVTRMAAVQEQATKVAEESIAKIEAINGALDDQFDGVIETLREIDRRLTPPARTTAATVRAPAPRPSSTIVVAGDVKLGKCELAILAALAGVDKPALSRAQVATLSGYSPKSSQFANACGALRSAGLVEYSPDGIALTPAGVAAIGARPVAAHPVELLAMWTAKLPKREGEMLDALARVNSHGMTRAELAEQIGMSLTSSQFANYLGHLHSNGLVAKGGDGRERIVAELAS